MMPSMLTRKERALYADVAYLKTVLDHVSSGQTADRDGLDAALAECAATIDDVADERASVTPPGPLPVEEEFTIYLDGDGDYVVQANRAERKEFLTAHGATPDEAVLAMRRVLEARATLDLRGAGPINAATPHSDDHKEQI